MALAFVIAVHRLPADLSFGRALSSPARWENSRRSIFRSIRIERYTFWSGIFGGFFLALSYFGADQSQVQRYLAGGSLSASRFGLLFNAIVKVPMQFLILLLGAMVFLFYQFEKPPIYFNQPAYDSERSHSGLVPQLNELQAKFDDVFARKRDLLNSSPQLRVCARNSSNSMRKARGLRDETQKRFSNRPAPVRKAKTPTTSSSLSSCTICRMALSDCSWR